MLDRLGNFASFSPHAIVLLVGSILGQFSSSHQLYFGPFGSGGRRGYDYSKIMFVAGLVKGRGFGFDILFGDFGLR